MHELWGDTRSWLISGFIIAGAVTIALVVHQVLFFILTRLSRRKGTRPEYSIAKRTKIPVLFVFILAALTMAASSAPLPPDVRAAVQHILSLGMIAAMGWGCVILVQLVSDLIYGHYVIDVEDNLVARRIRTQTQLLNRIVTGVAIVVTLSIMLMTIPSVRHIGLSLLASAGLVGLVVGMAAKSTLSSLLAGVQVAMTQPIRLDDAVVVEKEFGWIEEINTTYVVVKLWDLRRLILPLSYFIEKPFYNWTRTTADLLGTVILHTDYNTPVEGIRRELKRLLDTSPLWDKKAWALQVTDSTEQSLQLRALLSASNGSKLFDLQCYIREKLIQFIQQKYPESLPRQRSEQVASEGETLYVQGERNSEEKNGRKSKAGARQETGPRQTIIEEDLPPEEKRGYGNSTGR